MSHESLEPGRGVVYTLPVPFSDIFRTRNFTEFFQEYTGGAFSVHTLDGWSWSTGRAGIPQFVATFESREALDAIIDDASEATLGRLFLDGRLELSGNILVLLSIANFTIRHSDGLSHGLIQTIARLSHHFSRKLIPVHRVSAQQNWHYSPCPLNLPLSFFEPWLGAPLGHFSACLKSEGDDFEPAHQRALERACEWLEIQPADWILDIGCAWGSFATHAAKNHGAYVQGIASSDLQTITTAGRIHSLGLDSRCTVEQRDMRLKPYRSGEFDKVAHLGIFEQVGLPDFEAFLRCIYGLLAPGGLLLLYRMTNSGRAGTCITSLPPEFLSDGSSRELEIAEKLGFDVMRVESLRQEYEHTLRIWIDRLLDPKQSAGSRLFSLGYRAWMLYLIECLTCLNAGDAQVYAVVLRRP